MEWIISVFVVVVVALILFGVVKLEKKQRQFWEFLKMFIGCVATVYAIHEILYGQFDESKVPALLLSIISIMDSIYWFADRYKKVIK